jgi:DNA primase
VSIPPTFLDELRARLPLSPIIMRRVKLVKAGREWKGCCPFHNEKTPSFHVNDEKGFYHCFGCGAHGDVIRFLTDGMGLPFIEAVQQLASEAGLEMPQLTPEAAERQQLNQSITSLLGEAAGWFRQQLATEAGAMARAYLAKRGVTPALAEGFGLGFAPDHRSALRRHFNTMPEALLLEAGLIGKSESGEIFDRFRGRLMFPIRDRRGRVVGFGGRALADAQQPKYLNSADGPTFDKGRLLYNLDQAGPVARKTGRLLVVEGYMDVIGLARAGIVDAVAPLGTAITEDQLQLAWQLVDEPLLCLDGDAAGQRAAMRAVLRALPLLQPGKSLRIATLPAGEDPDDLVKRGGAAAVTAVLAGALPLIDMLWQAETAGLEQATPERRAGARARLRDHVNSIADANVRSLYAAELDQRFASQFLARPQRAAWQPGRRQPPGTRWQPPLEGVSAGLKARMAAGHDPGAMTLLAALLHDPGLADAHTDALAALPLPDDLAALRDALLAPTLAETGLDAHLLACDVLPVAARVRKTPILAAGGLGAAGFAGLVNLLAARPAIQAALRDTTARLAATMDEDDLAAQQALVAELRQVEADIMALAQGRGDG